MNLWKIQVLISISSWYADSIDFLVTLVIHPYQPSLLEQNFLSHLVTGLWSTAPSSFTPIFFVASAALWPSSNSLSISSWIRLHCTFIRAAFQSNLLNQCTICQHANYHDTTNHRDYLSWLGLLSLHDIGAAN